MFILETTTELVLSAFTTESSNRTGIELQHKRIDQLNVSAGQNQYTKYQAKGPRI